MSKPASPHYTPKPALPVQQPVNLEYREPRVSIEGVTFILGLIVFGFALGIVLAATAAGIL